MPARRRRVPGGIDPSAAPPDRATSGGRRAAQQEAAQVFADRTRAEREEQRQAARVRREAAEREGRRRELTKSKDRAADRLKDVRRRGAGTEARTEADAAYRAALDALIRDEQGLPPLAPDAEPAPPADGPPPPDAVPPPDD
ncbi:hypothetical protein [Iamia sp.]|uniref:hypothetical protein n=1 Tax=Iamia sp. TaxID=2722710 RepID=UPI002BD20F8A|nr:hypothetical protein [Iamia sp.]HXH58099.1 hypothetical protein [Iamia sp.]